MITDRRVLRLAVAARLATAEEIEFFNSPPAEPDPLDALTAEERITYAIAHAASGAPADLPPAVADIDGHPVLAPPGHRPARGPRGRSPQGRSPHPPTSKNLTEEGTPP